jgi:predicted N-acetyltransferase YhbS
MNLTLVHERDIGPELDKKIITGLCTCFPYVQASFSVTRAWHNSVPSWSLYLEENSHIISHVGVVDRTIRIGDQLVRVAGMQNVFVLPEYRGKGLCDVLMKDAMNKAAEFTYDYGFLFCIPEIEKVYRRCGWSKLPNMSIVRVDESGQESVLSSKNIAMYYPLAKSEFPEGQIHLQGNDW